MKKLRANTSWKNIIFDNGKTLTTNHLNLKNTLMNGQCFNWEEINNTYIGTLGKNVIALKEEPPNSIIKYKIIHTTQKNFNELKFFEDYFQLNVDLDSIYVEVKENLPDQLRDIMDRYTGVRIIKQDIIECIFSFICSSNNNITRIRKMLNSFKEEYGEFLYEHEEYGKFHSFPDFNKLVKSNITEKRLKEMGFGYRAKYIVESIEFIAKQSSNWIEQLKTISNPVDELIKLSGVGRKVADCICLFSLQRHHVVPLDVHMINFYNESIVPINKLFKKIANLNKNTYNEVAQNFIKVLGNYAGWLHSIFFMNRIDKNKLVEEQVKPILKKEVSIKKGKRKNEVINKDKPKIGIITNQKEKAIKKNNR